MKETFRTQVLRHPSTKSRAVVENYIPGRMTGAVLYLFSYRKRTPRGSYTFACFDDAIKAAHKYGYKEVSK